MCALSSKAQPAGSTHTKLWRNRRSGCSALAQGSIWASSCQRVCVGTVLRNRSLKAIRVAVWVSKRSAKQRHDSRVLRSFSFFLRFRTRHRTLIWREGMCRFHINLHNKPLAALMKARVRMLHANWYQLLVSEVYTILYSRQHGHLFSFSKWHYSAASVMKVWIPMTHFMPKSTNTKSAIC